MFVVLLLYARQTRTMGNQPSARPRAARMDASPPAAAASCGSHDHAADWSSRGSCSCCTSVMEDLFRGCIDSPRSARCARPSSFQRFPNLQHGIDAQAPRAAESSTKRGLPSRQHPHPQQPPIGSDAEAADAADRQPGAGEHIDRGTCGGRLAFSSGISDLDRLRYARPTAIRARELDAEII